MSEPRWLNSQEMCAWRGLLETSALLFTQLERELTRAHGLSMADYEILVRLSEAPDRSLRMTELANITLASKSRLSHQVSRMETRGLVRREGCATDRRGSSAVLTDEGFALLETAAPDHVRGVREHLFDQLTAKDVAALCQLTEHANAHLGSVVRP